MLFLVSVLSQHQKETGTPHERKGQDVAAYTYNANTGEATTGESPGLVGLPV